MKVLLEHDEDVDQIDEVARSILLLNVSVFFPLYPKLKSILALLDALL